MKHHTKDKGDLGVLKAKADLCGKGFLVMSPESEHSPFDLVTYNGGSFKRVQVKSRSLKNGTINVSFRSSWADKHGTHCQAIDKSQVDLYCIYCIENDTCYYLDPKSFRNDVTLRVQFSKHKQKNMHEAENFRHLPK